MAIPRARKEHGGYEFFASLISREGFESQDATRHAAPSTRVEASVGEKLEQYEPREVRGIVVGRYEMRYEVQGSSIFILRV
jgi:hypothetical protein